MSKHLVIVESPAKAKTINKILGSDYVVKASLGHIRDLPQKKLAVDIKNGFQPEYELIASRKKTIKELKDAAKTADRIYLAPDPDREGEAIAWHLMHALSGRKADADRFYRVTYNEITAPAIRRSFENPTRIDQHRVDAQQARRVLDRIVGYQVSPLLWRRIRGGSSAGRVQSVALRLICEREADIRRFTPEEYWVFGARVNKRVPPPDAFIIRLAKINGADPAIANEADADRVRTDLEQRTIVVSAINEREISRRARPPFITSTLQQSASSAIGFTPARTMSVAQRLYEGVDFGDGSVGLITYMRTDSPAISKDAQAACREFVANRWGADYLPEKPNFFKGRSSAQEAHEAIRPTDVARTPEEMASILKPEELKLYRLIWQRFVASQMAPARIAQRTVEFEAVAGQEAAADTYLFRATTSELVFAGFMKATGEDKKKVSAKEKADEDGEEEDTTGLPPLEKGESLDCQEWLRDQKFTKPPARFTEASLVRTLEENGVGRPSTYAQIIQTLYARKYMDKEKGALHPTEPGEKVNEFLVGYLGQLFDVQFTAQMEKELDAVEEGEVDWSKMMATFYDTFQGWLKNAKAPDADQGAARQLLELMQDVQTWDPPVKRGKRTYSDETFISSMREQQEKGEKSITMRQVEAVVKMAYKYREQIADLEGRLRTMGLEELWLKVSSPAELPRQSTLDKLERLKAVEFDPPRTVGKREYNDKDFCDSLRQQVEGGKRLSFNQVKYLDRLVQKYAKQIPDFEQQSGEWGIEKEETVPPEQIQPLLEQLAGVKEWKPPVKRGRREWSDEGFYQSLAKQFEAKQTLSAKQVASLRKLAARYGAAKTDGAPAA
jgi:DNA topoisomerase I